MGRVKKIGDSVADDSGVHGLVLAYGSLAARSGRLIRTNSSESRRLVLPLAWRLTPGLGAAGAALAWTIGQAAVAGLAVLLVRHLLRGWRRPPGRAQHVLVEELSEVP